MVDHEVQLHGAALNRAANTAPVLIGRSDPDFLNTMLREVRTPAGRADLLSTVVSGGTSASPSLLYQPVQRVMHIALMEAFCNTPGNPRLDSAKIDSAGVVIRRVPVDGNGKPDFQSSIREAWMQSSQGGVGWIKLNALQQALDPDPKQRRLLHTGQSYLDQVLNDKVNGPPSSEAVSPAFAAHPDVCADAKKTIIFALLPLSSSQLTTDPSAQTVDEKALRKQLPALLKAGNKMAPLAGQTITPDYASEDYARNHLTDVDQLALKSFILLLNMMALEFGIFDESPKPEATTLRSMLEEIPVTFQDKSTKTVSDFLLAAKAVLIDYDPNSPDTPRLQMPTAWPQITKTQEDKIFSATKTLVQQRLIEMRQKPSYGRFQDPERIYQLRAFIRVKHDEKCPPRIVWSDPSQFFRIAAWYDGPGVPTPPVVLPDLTNRKTVKKLRPNVSFGVPGGIFSAMQGISLDGLMKGNKGGGGDSSLDWICGFNIPIITICAFIVLSIFLSLLNIIFFWLPFVKICIPIPKGTLKP